MADAAEGPWRVGDAEEAPPRPVLCSEDGDTSGAGDAPVSPVAWTGGGDAEGVRVAAPGVATVPVVVAPPTRPAAVGVPLPAPAAAAKGLWVPRGDWMNALQGWLPPAPAVVSTDRGIIPPAAPAALAAPAAVAPPPAPASASTTAAPPSVPSVGRVTAVMSIPVTSDTRGSRVTNRSRAMA